MRYLPLAFALVISLSLSGCDVFGSGETAIRVTGRVVEAGTGAPIPGVAVFLYQQSSIIVPLGETRTGADGRFAVEHDDGESPYSLILGVNQRPLYEPPYDTFRERIVRGTTVDLGDIELERAEP